MDFLVNFLQTVSKGFLIYLSYPERILEVNSHNSSPGTAANVWANIQAALDQFYDLLWPMATAMAGVGMASMILLELYKTFPWKGESTRKSHEKFYREQIKNWINTQISKGKEKGFPFPNINDQGGAIIQTLPLTK